MEAHDLSKLRIESERRWSYAQQSRRKRVTWALALCGVAVTVLVVLAWAGLLTPPVEVHTAKVSKVFPSRALTVLNASGYVVAQRKAAVSSKATGRLARLYVAEGHQVKHGQILAQLENDDLTAAVEEAQAQLRVAEATLKNAEAELADASINYERLKSLKASGSISEQSFDTAEARYKKAVALERSAKFGVERARAGVKVAGVNLEYSLIRAPFDGVILTKDAEEGEVVAPFGASLNAKAAVVTMADMESLMVEVDVAESSIEKVKEGKAVEIQLDAFADERFPGRVYMIVPTADRSKATVMTKVKFDRLDPRILPQMSAKAAFLSRPLREGEDQPFLGIPVSSVMHSNGNNAVYRINQGRAHAVRIQTGRSWGDTVEVVRGLKDGDIVALKPTRNLGDGTRVKVLE